MSDGYTWRLENLIFQIISLIFSTRWGGGGILIEEEKNKVSTIKRWAHSPWDSWDPLRQKIIVYEDQDSTPSEI